MTEATSGVPVVVVMAAYNALSTIDQALASVAAQTVAPNEVVVCDDCSTDDTVAAAARWQDRLPITVIRATQNAGPSAARARAIDASHSPLVAPLDADDLWLPDHLETLSALHDRHGGIALARWLRWSPGETLGNTSGERAVLPDPLRQLRRLYLGNYAWIATLFERSLYERAGGFRPQIRVGEEWDLYIRMLRLGARFEQAGHPTALYRIRPGSLMWDDEGIGDRVRVLELAEEESSDDSDRREAHRGLRALRAERALWEAYALAAAGRTGRARLRALGAAAGQRRVALRGAAMVIAPRSVASARQRARMATSRRAGG